MKNSALDARDFDVVVVGGGHAGCEAALAAARMGSKTALITPSRDKIALMPCNPSIGGPAKGHLVREIDAMGGAMARAIDSSSIQIRMLNCGKGPAVQAPRAQADKVEYQRAMLTIMDNQPNLVIIEAMVDELATEDCRIAGVVTESGLSIASNTVILTTGTFLNGRIITGEKTTPAGRAGEAPSVSLAGSLSKLGFPLRRLKTGTPPRIRAGSIDYSKTILQPGSEQPVYFSQDGPNIASLRVWSKPAAVYPYVDLCGWQPQMPCYLVHTNESVHRIIRENLHRAPLYSGVIEGTGPRYCPSIEDKIVRFAHKESHQLFLEPEGWNTDEVYVQGANTSLPEDIQLEMLRAIPALSNVQIVRYGYAVEYDAVPSSEIDASLQTKRIQGLFLAGQINGTSGYEEAAAQGLMAGINATLLIRGEEPVVLGRDEAYLGVMIDDLVTKDLAEPYRLMTSRAEFRLLLRADNADLRLAPLAYRLGLIDEQRRCAVSRKQELTDLAVATLHRVNLTPTAEMAAALAGLGQPSLSRPMSAAELLGRPDLNFDQVMRILESVGYDGPDVQQLRPLPLEVAEQVTVEIKYSGYIDKQRRMVERVSRLEQHRLPSHIDYSAIQGLRNEARENLGRFRPLTIGQASRLEGVNPADIAVLLVHLERLGAKQPIVQ